MRRLFNWRVVSLVLSSPIVKASVLVPLVGYLLIYSSGENGAPHPPWLNTLGLSGEPFWFSADAKLRMMYYGGILIMSAILVYWWKCPDQIKNHSTASEARSSFVRDANPAVVHQANERITRSFLNNKSGRPSEQTSRHSNLVKTNAMMAVLDYYSSCYKVSADQNNARFSLDELKRFEEGIYTNFESFEQAYKQFNKLNQDCLHIHSRWNDFSSLRRRGAEVIHKDYKVLERSEFHYLCGAVLLTLGGAVLLVLPAIETFAHVISIDVGMALAAITGAVE